MLCLSSCCVCTTPFIPSHAHINEKLDFHIPFVPGSANTRNNKHAETVLQRGVIHIAVEFVSYGLWIDSRLMYVVPVCLNFDKNIARKSTFVSINILSVTFQLCSFPQMLEPQQMCNECRLFAHTLAAGKPPSRDKLSGNKLVMLSFMLPQSRPCTLLCWKPEWWALSPRPTQQHLR